MNFALQGVAVGLPWNALLVATDFYRERISTRELATVESWLALFYISANLIAFGFLNRPGNGEKESVNTEAKYVRWYYLLNALSFSMLAALPWFPDEVSSDDACLGVVLTVATLMGASSAFCQHSLFAFSARDGPTSTQSYLLGFALSGAAASAFSALVSGVGSNAQTSGTLTFALATASLFCGAFSFLCYLEPRAMRKSDETFLFEAESDGEAPPSLVFRENEPRRSMLRLAVATVSLSLAGTLLVFPGFISSFKAVSSKYSDAEFTLFLFLQFNLGDAVGRLLSGRLLSGVSDFVLFGLVIIRSGLIVLFALCNRDDLPAESTMSDELTMQLVFFQAVAGGMLFAQGAMRAPKATPDEPGRAGKIVATAIAVSLAAGAFSGNLLVHYL